MADGPSVWVFPIWLLLLWVANDVSSIRDSSGSIDKKMHTHAADGSINGIRGWY